MIKSKSDIEDFSVYAELCHGIPITATDRLLECPKMDQFQEDFEVLEEELSDIDKKIHKYTNYADSVDYSVSAICGIVCGMIDCFIIGEFNFQETLSDVNTQINNAVKNKAKNIQIDQAINDAIKKAKSRASKRGAKLSDSEIKELIDKIKNNIENHWTTESDAIDGLRKSIAKLERFFKIPSDNLFKGVQGMNPASHHLDDMAHHPTLLGLVAAIVGQILKLGIFVDKDGKWHIKFKEWESKEECIKTLAPILISGICLWLLYVARKKNKESWNELPKPIKGLVIIISQTPALKSILKIISNWEGHLMSDIAGSKSTPGEGMGIPGIFLSLLYEISSVPPLNITPLHTVLNDIYTNNRFDFRKECAVLAILGKQAIPVICGDIIVRCFYFIRRLHGELSRYPSLKSVKWGEIKWSEVIPFDNRTVTRLLAIESATFEVIDLSSALFKSFAEGGSPENPAFWTTLAKNVNYVGAGKLMFHVGDDLFMQIKLEGLKTQRLHYVVEDEDLQFLSHCKNKDLLPIADLLANDQLSKLCNNVGLRSYTEYSRYYPKELSKLVPCMVLELSLYGGNTIANRGYRFGKGIKYKEILCDVCDKLKVDYDKRHSVSKIEEALIKKVCFQSSTDTNVLSSVSGAPIGAEAYMPLLPIIIQQTIKRLTINASSKLISQRLASIAIGPFGWLLSGFWALYEAAGPAYRITIPCVLQIAYLRRK